jgi:hypothetical protein
MHTAWLLFPGILAAVTAISGGSSTSDSSCRSRRASWCHNQHRRRDYATWSSFPVEVEPVLVSSAIEASLR